MIIIDRIEGDRAILEVDGEMVEISACILPSGSSEGSFLSLNLCEDAAADMQRDNEERLARLRKQDSGDMEIDI
jgi:hypothetical protein